MRASSAIPAGWYGAVIACLPIAAIGLTGSDVGVAFAACVSMAVIVRLALDPSVSMLPGTLWDLLRHRWVVMTGDSRVQRIQLVLVAGGGLLVLLGATVLSIVRPWGMAPYAQRGGPPQG